MVATPEKFNFNSPLHWPQWRKRFESYMLASGLNSKSEEDKIDSLLFIMGNDSKNILLEFPEIPSTYIEALEKFESHFIPRKNIIFEKYKFNSRVQTRGESIESFITCLQSLAEHCQYGVLKDELIRDKIVVGMLDKKTSKRLRLKSTLTLSECIFAVKQAELQAIQRIEDRKAQKSRYLDVKINEVSSNTGSNTKCPSCGLQYHRKDNCPANKSICKKCKRLGHWSTVCETLGNNQSTPATEPKTCNQCKQVITGGVLTALGKSWHSDHFCCNECKKPITESRFHTNEDLPYCTPCHTKLFAKTCHACDEPILDKCVQAMGVNWHEDHFLCNDCKAKLIGTQFMELEGVPYCQKCYLSKHAAKCKGCSKPIADKAIVALDAKWHQMCFRCSKCEKPIMKDQSFQVDGGKPHCVKC